MTKRIRKFFLPDLNRGFFIRLACVAAAAYVIFGHVIRPMRIRGESMLPTYRNGQFSFCFTWKYTFRRPQPGDIVMVKYAGRKVLLLKRVVAVGGQTVEFRYGRLFVDGELRPEPYASKPCNWELPPREVKPGHVYVIGDNRSVPMDTHHFGQTPLSRIEGGPIW